MSDSDLMARAVQLAERNVREGGQPFGAVLTRNGEVLAEAVNETHLDFDPTAHAEVQALRQASRALRNPDLSGTTMYASGLPCAVCMAAMINAGVTRVLYCAGEDAGAPYGFSTASLYERMAQPFGAQGVTVEHLPLPEAADAFKQWQDRRGNPVRRDG